MICDKCSKAQQELCKNSNLLMPRNECLDTMIVCDNCIHSFMCKYRDTMTPQDKCNCYKNRKKPVTLYRVVVVYIVEGGEHREHEYSVYDDEEKASEIVDKIREYPCIRIQEYKGKWTYTIYRVYMEPMTPTNEPFHAEQFAKRKTWGYE